MRAICKYSGLPIFKTPYLLGFDVADVHPIFRTRKKHLITPQMVHRFAKSEIFEEKKLIFLGVLNATELVDWRVIAEPSLATVETNFYKLMHTAGWLSHAEYTYTRVGSFLSFPQYVINDLTKDLTSLNGWLRSLEDLKDSIIRKDVDRDRAAALTNRENEIRREIGEAAFSDRAFTPTLARWALDFAELNKEDEKYNRYVKVLCTPLKDAFVYDIDELRDIEEYLENHLPAEHPQVISVMAQIRTLITQNKNGFKEFAVFSDDDDPSGTFTILEDGSSVTGSQHLVDVPTDEPQLKDYKSKIDYLVAHAKWKLSTRERPVSERKLVKTPPPQISNVTAEDV